MMSLPFTPYAPRILRSLSQERVPYMKLSCEMRHPADTEGNQS